MSKIRPDSEGILPDNVLLGNNTWVGGDLAFKRFHSTLPNALVLGDDCTMDGVHFDLGPQGRVVIGNFCYFTNVVILSEMEVTIGDYVMIGWNTIITDTDFHPLEPAQRIADAIACSPLGKGRPRPPVLKRPVIIENDVWIGPGSTILKGVHIGSGAFVEPGSVVTGNVQPRARVMGNPARMIGEVE
jgi:acetyltransferase-like isoleucine patch superfamily enzyme